MKMIPLIKNLIVVLVFLQLITGPVAKAQQSAFLDSETKVLMGPADFVVKRYPNQKLIPVRLIGGVTRAGFYQIPEDTSLLSLMAYSAGSTQTADLEMVTILRKSENKTYNVNIKDLLQNPEYQDPILTANDVIYVQDKKQWFSNNTVATLTVISSMLAIVLSTYLIRDRVQGKY